MQILIDRFLHGDFNHIVPMTFILLAMILGSILFRIRYTSYRRKKEKYTALLKSGETEEQKKIDA